MKMEVFCSINSTAGNIGNGQAEDVYVLKVVRLLNAYEQSPQAQLAFRATPHWLWSGVPNIDPTHGCPVTPPFPVEDGGRSGQWKTRFPMLSDKLENASGPAVPAFILDSFPPPPP